jgi:hypothetical protein
VPHAVLRRGLIERHSICYIPLPRSVIVVMSETSLARITRVITGLLLPTANVCPDYRRVDRTQRAISRVACRTRSRAAATATSSGRRTVSASQRGIRGSESERSISKITSVAIGSFMTLMESAQNVFDVRLQATLAAGTDGAPAPPPGMSAPGVHSRMPRTAGREALE